MPSCIAHTPASEHNELYVCGLDKTKKVTHLSTACVHDKPEGQTAVDAHGRWCSTRLPDSAMLTESENDQLFNLTDRWSKLSSHLPRGEEHAAICVGFYGGGIKGGQDERLGMNHSQVLSSTAQALEALKVQKELDETKIVLHKTIDSVLDRGEKLNSLVEKSTDLSMASQMFYKQARKQNQCCTLM